MPEFPLDDWTKAGNKGDAQVPMAVQWNDDEDAFEFTSLDGSYYANLEDWNKYLGEFDSYMETVMGPHPETGEGKMWPWFRVVGPAAKDMYESAKKRREATPLIPSEGVDSLGTVWRMIDGDTFQFRPRSGRMLTPIEKKRWQAICKAEKSLFKIVKDEESGGELYQVGLPLSMKMRRVAIEDEDSVHADKESGVSRYDSMVNLLTLGDLGDPGYRHRFPPHGDFTDDPKWEGSPSFNNCLRSTDWMLQQYNTSNTGVITSCVAVGADARTSLAKAHPIAVPPLQAEVLPMPSLEEAIDFLHKSKLPFDPLFLDLSSGPNPMDMTYHEGHAPAGDHKAILGMAGASIGTDTESGMKFCVPFGAVVVPDEEEHARRILREMNWEEVPGARAYKEEWGFCLSDAANNGIPSHGPIASIIYSDELTASSYGGFGIRLTADGAPVPLDQLHLHQPDPLALVFVSASAVGGPKNCAALLAIPEPMAYSAYSPEEREKKVHGWASIAFLHFRRAMSVLMFLDHHNVELVEAKVSRQVRRQAERKNIPISKTVYIRHRMSNGNRPDYDPNAPREIGTTHRFEVIGHTRHFKQGSHVWCKACKGTGEIEGPLLPNGHQDLDECEECGGLGLDRDKLTTCVRRDQHGNLTCPNGCRKEWVPPFVKGDPDAPLIPKARKT